MTDRIRTLTVVLDKDTRDDDAEHYVRVIGSIKGVTSVELGPVVDLNDHIARDDARRALGKKIWALITGKELST